MKHISRSKKSFLWQAVLASTFFGGFPFAAQAALTPIVADTTTALTPDTGAGAGGLGGYDFTADNITLSVTDGYIIGRTPDAALGTSVDNNNAGAAKLSPSLIFLGSSVVQGQIGTTNPIDDISLQGINKTVQFNDDIKLYSGIRLEAAATDGTIVFADGVDVTGFIDNLAGAGKGKIEFEGSGSASGSIGGTNAFQLLTINSNGGANKAVELNGALIKSLSMVVNDDTATATTLKFNNPNGQVVGNITAKTNNLDVVDFFDTDFMTGNVGTGTTGFATVKVGATDDLALTGNIYAKTTEFQADNTLTLSDGNSIIGNVDTTVAGNGILEFLGAGSVTGTIGATNAINQLIMDGAAKTVTLGGNTKVTNSVNFSGSANTLSVLNINDGVTITGNLDNKTAASAGIVNFLGTGGVTGTTGATQAINTINLNGGAGKMVTLGGNVTVGAGNLNFAAGSTATSILQLSNNVTVTGNIDNTTGTPNIGTLNFTNNGKVTGTIGASNALNIINLQGAGTVEFDGNVKANVTNIDAGVTAKYADDVILTGSIEGPGSVNFEGGGQVTGNIGATNNLALVTLNSSSAQPNETITLNGAIINATTIEVKDDGATPTTLILNNPAMAVTGKFAAETAGLNILDILRAAQITGQIGALGNEFNLVKVAQNGNTLIDGDIFTNTLQFNGPNTLTLTDNSDINGNVTTTVNNQGILQLQGTSSITGTIGSAGLALNAINILGLNKLLSIGDDTFVNNINIANDSQVTIQDDVDFIGNINNTSGADGKGDILFKGTGSIAGNIGASNTLDRIIVNSLVGAGETVTLSGNVVRANQIDVQGNTTTLKLDNGIMTLSTPNGIITSAPGVNTLDIHRAALINSDIGDNANNFNLIKVGAVGNTIINGDIYATTTEFQGNNKLILIDGSDVNGNIDSTAADQGKLELRGNHTITGTVGVVNSVNTIDISGIGKTVNFNGSITVGTGNLNIASPATCATTVNFADNVNITGNIDNTTFFDNRGTLNFLGSSIVAGTIGATKSICQINLKGGAAEVVQFADDVKVGTGNINFAVGSAATSELQIGDGAIITGNIDNTTGANGIGTLTFLGDSTMNNTIGATHSLFLVNLTGAAGKTVTFNQNVNANTLTFTDNGNAIIAGGVNIAAPMTTTNNNQGNLFFQGNYTVNPPNTIGAPGLALNSINVSNGAALSLLDDIYAANTNINAGGSLFAQDVITIGGNVNVANSAILGVASVAAPLTVTGNLAVPAGATLQIDLNNINIPTYIAVGGDATINANSILKLTNTPQAYQAGIYEIKIVDAVGAGSVIGAPAAIGDSLLLSFETIADNVNHDLLLKIDVKPASIFADRINTIGVAGALDAMAGNDYLGSLQNLLDQLPYFTTVEQLNDGLAALAPIVDGSFTQETFAAQQLGYGAVSDRIRHMRQQRLIPAARPYFESGISSGDDWDENGHGRWFKLYGQYADQDIRESVPGYNSETWGVAIGSDVSLNDLNLVGVSANLSHTYVSHNVSDTKSSIYSLQAAIYGEQDFCDWWYFNWIASVAYNKYTTERNFVFGLLPFSPKADFNGWQFGSKGELGYEYIYNGVHIIPNTSLYYSYLALTGYNESGAGTASQSVDAQYYNMLKGGVGVRAAYYCPYDMGDRRSIIFQPEVRMNVFYDFINDNMESTSNFTGGGPSFVTVGATPAATSLNLGASLSMYSDFNNYVVTLSYDFETKPDYHANAGFVRLRYEW